MRETASPKHHLISTPAQVLEPKPIEHPGMATSTPPSLAPALPAANVGGTADTATNPVGTGTTFQISIPISSQPQASNTVTTPMIACPTTKPGFALGQFDERSQGDCIVKSSDGIKFRVYALVLKLASSVWQDMFELPQPPSQGDLDELQKLPIIELSENSSTLSALLHLLYPKGKSQIKTFDLAFKLMDAYHKYDIDISGLAPFFVELLSTATIQANPLEVYGLAWRLRNGDVVSHASRYLHEVSLEKRDKKERVVRSSADFAALAELYDLRLKRELALDGFVARLPLSEYRCKAHVNLSAEEAMRLRVTARRALATADPKCIDLVRFFNLREVFSNVASPPTATFGNGPVSTPAGAGATTSNFSFTFNAGSPLSSASSPGQSGKAACQECEKALTPSNKDSSCAAVNDAIAAFPQAVSRTF